MTKFTLAEAIGNINEKQIQRALNYKRKASKLLWLVPAAACLILAVCIIPMAVKRISTYPPDSGSNASSDSRNPGGATGNSNYLSYNGEYFEFDHCVIRIVYDESGRIIEPDKTHWDADIKETLEAADDLDALQYLGTGDVLGTDPNAKLYMMSSGNILAVRPCILEPYADAEEMLEKYSADKIFEVNTFIKV